MVTTKEVDKLNLDPDVNGFFIILQFFPFFYFIYILIYFWKMCFTSRLLEFVLVLYKQFGYKKKEEEWEEGMNFKMDSVSKITFWLRIMCVCVWYWKLLVRKRKRKQEKRIYLHFNQ